MAGDDRHHQPGVSLDDATIIARVLDGDVQQFAHLVERYQAPLYRHAVCLVLDHDVAADMVQDAFVRAYTKLATCRNPTHFRAWVFQTLRHRCFDYLKDVRRKHVPLDTAGDIGDRADGPDGQMERRWLRNAIGQALQQLPDPQREAFLMHYVEQVPYDVMAEVLEASVSALKMRVWRARDTLIAALQAQDVTPGAASSSCSQVGTRRWVGTWVPEEEA